MHYLLIDKVKHTEFLTLFGSRTILRMNNLWRKIQHYSSQHLAIAYCLVQFNVLRKSAVQQFYFLQGVNRMHVMTSPKVVVKHLPECGIVVGASYRHSCLLCPTHPSTTYSLPAHVCSEEDIRGIVACYYCGVTHMIHGVQVLFCRQTMIHPRHTLVVNTMNVLRPQIVV